ncbi:hypothetical protein HD553DRAFT_342641 [Filobasidium floriforme]|uniref:uncharacterized protein n=1 Tax=Filobasidium floriforme TaxID=5210 RepID=UPI001E8E617A|nr:uncharacterized protein HD553DRAFT_342641 [Filobasidium floriforme]KAH8084239.1 hypothetical protein HD553DRAFT_342641 [Filobasidium floriforme]
MTKTKRTGKAQCEPSTLERVLELVIATSQLVPTQQFRETDFLDLQVILISELGHTLTHSMSTSSFNQSVIMPSATVSIGSTTLGGDSNTSYHGDEGEQTIVHSKTLADGEKQSFLCRLFTQYHESMLTGPYHDKKYTQYWMGQFGVKGKEETFCLLVIRVAPMQENKDEGMESISYWKSPLSAVEWLKARAEASPVDSWARYAYESAYLELDRVDLFKLIYVEGMIGQIEW